MPNQPFSAPKPRSLPTYTNTQDVAQTLANWQTQLNPLVKNVAPQPTPLNFGVTNSRGGLMLTWSPVSGGDGYEILKSASGTFTDDLQVIPIKDTNQSSFFDSTGGNAQSASYRIRATSGTAANPQSQRGPESGPIRHTSIDASDTKSVPTTILDNYTTDKTRSLARRGNYGAIRKTPLGLAGGSTVASGSKTVKGSTAGRAATGTQSFSQLGTSTNNTATLTVGSGAQIIPDPLNPGVIDATEIQGTPVSTTAPTTDGQALTYVDGQLEYLSIIATGPEGSLTSVLPLEMGQMYVATDTGSLFVGTPGIGAGYVQVGDTTQVLETLQKLLLEIRAMRLAMTSLACQGGQAAPTDFEPQNAEERLTGN